MTPLVRNQLSEMSNALKRMCDCFEDCENDLAPPLRKKLRALLMPPAAGAARPNANEIAPVALVECITKCVENIAKPGCIIPIGPLLREVNTEFPEQCPTPKAARSIMNKLCVRAPLKNQIATQTNAAGKTEFIRLLNDAVECVVCMEKIAASDFVVMSCKHASTCNKCIQSLVTTARNNGRQPSCPSCRANVTFASLGSAYT
jgi:hypothetical protein